MWDYSLEGRVFDIEGRKLQIEEQLTESLLKIRYELNPKDFDFEDPREVKEIAEERYCHEVEAAILLGERGLGPKYRTHETQYQEEWMPFPGGYIDFFVMQLPPGENVNEIQDELTNRQLESIRTQLAYILETMRKNGYTLVQQHPSFLNYDARTNKLYLIDLADLDFTNPETSYPIDEESPYVEAFNIWRAPYSKSEKGSKSGRMPPSGQSTKKANRPPWRS
ncbi:hypothetical protein ANOM_005216 [Aspergillus nomiae NRRL 13137]|uniref:Protein kinase domain-containing protein n=1 Tax=Aspergillus nomiae NRRL (strain ATCC 15546 / NRRL 13137 / CBS 260.88 / M93) TaxID=1509407 RepID=A0A0L1J3J7_ASPN3|nr:uncharacterized protein ANOM_005216 [Aspergillus nomiae NRRL 13137]KNG86317.1 hypothetical protein ANOM_005216 [Aspergillus nomiae NRRL 13137]